MIKSLNPRPFIWALRKRIAPIEALIRLSPFLWASRRDPDLHLICESYIDWMPLSLFSNPLGWIQQLVKGKTRFHRAYQQPHSFFVPHLKGLPFHSSDAIAQHLIDHWEEIRGEFYAVEHLEISTPSTSLIDTGRWNTFPLMRAAKEIPENTDRCPKTWAVVNDCPLLNGIRGGVYFSIVYPGTHIDSHCGPSNLKLRYHLTIEEADGAKIRSAETWNTWKQGQCLILDDSFEHEVVHTGDKRRVVLIVDCWHPGLSPKEQDFLTDLHEIWR